MASINIEIEKEQLIDLIKALHSNVWSKEDEKILKSIVEKLLSDNMYYNIINSNMEEFNIIYNDLLDSKPDSSLSVFELTINIDPDALNNLLQTAILYIKCMPEPNFIASIYPNIENTATILVKHWGNINKDQTAFDLIIMKLVEKLSKTE